MTKAAQDVTEIASSWLGFFLSGSFLLANAVHVSSLCPSLETPESCLVSSVVVVVVAWRNCRDGITGYRTMLRKENDNAEGRKKESFPAVMPRQGKNVYA
jgi:hypothetical protein